MGKIVRARFTLAQWRPDFMSDAERPQEKPADSRRSEHAMMSKFAMQSESVEKLVQSLEVLIVEDNQYMRKVIRNLLVNVGVKFIHEAVDGIAGLEAIRSISPDVVILDWEMPLLSGPELVRIVRSPGVFPVPDVPIIMLTGHGERWRVMEAVRLGVNEFLVKPVSAKALFGRMVSIVAKPRPMVQVGEFYVPEPRRNVLDAEAPAESSRANSEPPPPVPDETPLACAAA
jgi:two-component system, chemotaxis family, chemotaxis protein CheY